MTDEEIKTYAENIWGMIAADGITLVDIIGICIVLLNMTRHAAIAAQEKRILDPKEVQ